MPQTPLPRSAKSVVQFLLQYLSPDERSIPGDAAHGNSRIESAVDALNGALQEIHAMAHSWLYRQEKGIYVEPPVTTTGTFTKGSKVFTPAASDWANWMEGCTIAVAGTNDNQILGYDPITLKGVLRDPHSGDSGSLVTTVYHDSIPLGEDIGEVLYPVWWGGNFHLREVGGLGEAVNKSTDYQFYEDYGYDNRVRSGGFPRDLLKQSINPGTPAYYWVDTFWSDLNLEEKRMRLAPLPKDGGERVLFNAKLACPQYGLDDVLHTSDGPLPMVVQSNTDHARMRLSTTDTSIKFFPCSDIKNNARQSYSFSVSVVDDVTIQLDISGLSQALTTGDAPLMWYDQTASACTEGTLLRFPNTLVDAVLKKVAAQHFRQSPFFKNREAITEIERGYSAALQVIARSKPQNKNSLRRTVVYG
tara:strand:+ start:1991 stop:3241 length:1251 start_codon:yes stop_codon:yes gene_type:complete